jgi:hypothetical protein
MSKKKAIIADGLPKSKNQITPTVLVEKLNFSC